MSWDQSSDRWNLRLWPGLVLVAVVAFCLFVPVRIAPQSKFHFLSFVLGPILGSLLAILWWTTYSRTTRPERVWVPLLFVLPAFAVAALDFARGDTPILPLIFGLPFVLALWVGWLTISLPLDKPFRLTGLFVMMVCGWIAVGSVRMSGDGDMYPELVFRFSPRPEDAVRQELDDRPIITPKMTLEASRQQDIGKRSDAVDIAIAVGMSATVRYDLAGLGHLTTTFVTQKPKPGLDWPEFRGPNRDSVLAGVAIDPDWVKHPPKPLWKQKIGPGWGTFSAVGDRLFTQEQRGDNEAVVCYDAATGGEIWRHFETAKFYETIAQAGPRATPTVVDGKVYAQGATGLLVCLNAEDGKPLWKTDITADTGGVLPQWGYASSPLVLDGRVIVYTGGPDGRGTSAFDAATGKLAWSAGKATHGYSSAQRVAIAGVEQVLMLSDFGLESFDAATGKVLWEFAWSVKGFNRVTQPTVIGDGEFLIGTGVGGSLGTRKVTVTKDGNGWKVEPGWFSPKVHPYFNDGVIFGEHYFGFASKSLVCVSLINGKVVWDAGTKYAYGQVLLLKDSGLLVVQAESGKVYLVKATPDDHTEEAKLDAIPGKTWNHPVVNRGRLYVRNGEWAAAYELKIK